jgi:phytoene/squalene synthetase
MSSDNPAVNTPAPPPPGPRCCNAPAGARARHALRELSPSPRCCARRTCARPLQPSTPLPARPTTLPTRATPRPAQRLHDLAAYRADLQPWPQASARARWAAVFGPLQAVLRSHALPVPLLDDLLSAFIQDVEKTRDAAGLRRPRRAAGLLPPLGQPRGPLLLHLYGVTGAQALEESDAICTALQLINFWQDLSVDIPRGRHYLPDADCAPTAWNRRSCTHCKARPNTTRLITDCARWARDSMEHGAPLVHRLPGRAGWELRLVVQGGLRILGQGRCPAGRQPVCFGTGRRPGLAPAGEVLLLCFAKEKYPKERRPCCLRPCASLRATCGAPPCPSAFSTSSKLASARPAPTPWGP